MDVQQKLFLSEGPLCRGCPWRNDCGAMHGSKACKATWRDRTSGGGQVLHPAFPITAEFMANVGGAGFEGVEAHPTDIPALSTFTPQIRMRRALRGQLLEPLYAITAGQVIGTRSMPATAMEIRNMVGLRKDQQIMLLLFGKDKYLEYLWDHRDKLVPALAAAGFALIVAPSYSAWEPRPRPELLYANKRSLVIFQELQALGASAIPRITWTVPYDAERWALWANSNEALSHVGLDLTTYRGSRGYAEQIELLSRFDRLTDQRLSYIVNGPSTFNRIVELLEATAPDRVHVTNSRAIARDGLPRVSYVEKTETEKLIAQAARRAVEKELMPAAGRAKVLDEGLR